MNRRSQNRRPHHLLILAAALLLLSGTAGAAPGDLLHRLDNPAPGIADQYAEAIAVSGDLLVVGASRDDSPGLDDDAGAVYVYRLSTGALLHTIPHPDPVAYDGFGAAVSVYGDRILVGAPFRDAGGVDVGAAYCFSALTGNLLGTLSNPDPTDYGQFGFAVAAGQGMLVVGAPRNRPSPGEIDGGLVYLFDETGVMASAVANPRPDPYDQFGAALALEGEQILVGAPNEDDGGVEAGAAYLIHTGTGAVVRIFENPEGTDFGQFGASVDLNAATAAVGAPFGSTPGSVDNAGVAFLFRLSDGALAGTLANPSPSYSEQFGRSVALSGDVVLVGAPYDSSPGSFDNGGGAHLFDGAGDLLLTLANPDPSFRDAFGHAVAAGTGAFAVGAFRDDSGAPRSGSAFVFQGMSRNSPPDVSLARASVTHVWPPNGRMIDVDILSVTDPENDPVSVDITGITQDEPVDGAPDAEGIGTSSARIRAKRDGGGNGRVYRIAFRATDSGGASADGSVAVQVPHDRRRGGTAVDDGQLYDALVPSAAKPTVHAEELVVAGYPNPFNPSTTIAFTAPEAAGVTLAIYNVLGQEVRRLVDGRLGTGAHRVRWDGRDNAGRELAGGVYVYRLVVGSRVAVGRLLFAK